MTLSDDPRGAAALRTAIDEALGAVDDEWTVAELSELVLGERAVFLPDGLARFGDRHLEGCGCPAGLPRGACHDLAALLRSASPEPRRLICERNESAASAHGHTADCSTSPEPRP